MFMIVYRTAAGSALLLIMPASIWISGWAWKPGYYTGYLKMLYWITETVTHPWGIMTHALLSLWFLWCLRFRLLRPAMIVSSILCVAILLGQGIKIWIKNNVQEPRPFIIWLEKKHHISVDTFYNLKREDRADLIKMQIKHEENVPNFLRMYWQKETGFAFPSGHTMFAVSWALFGMGLLRFWHHPVTIIVLLIWASGVMLSRLLLGMHCPRDLVVSTLISWILVTFSICLVQKLYGSFFFREKERKQGKDSKKNWKV